MTEISNTVQVLTINGIMSLRDNTEYDNSNSLININDDFADFFSSVSYNQFAGQHAVQMNLTDEGFEKINKVLTSASEGTAYIFAGEQSLGLTIELGTALEAKTMYFTPSASSASDFSIVLNSIIGGGVITNSYNTDSAGSGTVLIASTSAFGDYAAIYLLVAVLLIIIAQIVLSVIKYKTLGWVNAIITVIYALVIVTSLMLIGTQLTIAGAFTAVLGLALLTFSNFYVFEAVRQQTKLGRVISASIKTGYKNRLFTILDLHIVVLIVSILMALICVGELAACGLILFIATIASYSLYWFTRFMWYVISSLAKDKVAFCGYSREVFENANAE